jgi:chromosome segregation ATPase
MSITQLQKQIAEREAQMATLESAKNSATSRIQALEAERKSLILPARTGDQAAKTRVAEIDQECATAQRGIHDDDAAIAQLTHQVETLREQIAAAEKETKREQLRKSATAAAENAWKNVSLASSLMEGVKASLDELSALGREAAHSDVTMPTFRADALSDLVVALSGAHFTTRHVAHLGKLENFASGLQNFASELRSPKV